MSKYKNVLVVSDNKVAVDSPDHICPVGTKSDNSTNGKYIKEVEEYFNGEKKNLLDIGCAGGQLAVDFAQNGHFSLGVEGSSYPIENERENWVSYHGTVLHTADLTKPYHVEKDGEKILFDLISAWEVIEHIHPDDLDNFFNYILSNLKPGGIFVGSINVSKDERILPNGEKIVLHQSVFPKEVWMNEILPKKHLKPYPFKEWVRGGPSSFHIALIK